MNRERRKLYHPGWRKESYHFRAGKNFTCEHCGIKQGEERVSRRTGVVYKVSTHAAHTNFGETHVKDAPKLCLCEVCHGRYDYEHLKQTDSIRFEKVRHKLLLLRRCR